jgi:Uncharacterised nucleotidyltransferase
MTLLPPRKEIEQGLSQATERFAAELARPLPVAPSWSDFDWQMARAAAILHGIGPLLASTLRWSGPTGWQLFLREQRSQTLQRHRDMAAALQEIEARAVALGVALVALKGTALHALGIYAPGERPMADIDLLVRPVDTERAAQMLVSLGYTQTWVIWKHRIFERGAGALAPLPPGNHLGYPLKVELHERIVERLPCSETDITTLVFPAQPRSGLNPYPATNALLVHLLLHATDNMCARSIRLMHLHDIARLAAQATLADWEQLLGTLSRLKGLWWAFPPLAMVSRYQPGLLPLDVLDALRCACPSPLRSLCEGASLSQMSYASVSISAFPGLAWCTSPREAVRYVRKRILPDGEQLLSRRLLATERWTERRPWSQMSQRQRMLQWVFRRPPRQASMYIVRAALESPLQI